MRFLHPHQAAQHLGISTKALRLYEKRGLLVPHRTDAGWRAYSPDDLVRAAEIVALRSLGLSLAEVARALAGDLDAALAAHQAALVDRNRELAATIKKVYKLRARPPVERGVSFALPWPWGGERFELAEIRSLNYIIGPLGSGKTRFAMRLAEVLPDAAYIGLDRLADDGAAARAQLDADPALAARVKHTLAGLVASGATVSGSLIALLAGLEAEGPAALVVDMIEDGLDHATQEAVIEHLRATAGARPLFVMTRSSAILDLAAVGSDEAIIFCPANHSPPLSVLPCPGAPGYEAVATCLGSPEVRARTRGAIATA